jgi:hypothetical protein
MMSLLSYTLLTNSRVAESYITQVILALRRWQTAPRVSQQRAWWVLALDARGARRRGLEALEEYAVLEDE